MIEEQAIRRFLARWESTKTVAYIPCRKRNFTGSNPFPSCGDVIGASGVTIATGIDLGQQSEADMHELGVPDTILVRLRPYFGLQKLKAVDALMERPLVLSPTECEIVDRVMHADYIRRAATLYDRHTQADRFAQIPWQAQTVIVSLFYQLGMPFPLGRHAGYPVLYGYLCSGDWEKASDELIHGFKRFALRRAEEGRLLKELV